MRGGCVGKGNIGRGMSTKEEKVHSSFIGSREEGKQRCRSFGRSKEKMGNPEIKFRF